MNEVATNTNLAEAICDHTAGWMREHYEIRIRVSELQKGTK